MKTVNTSGVKTVKQVPGLMNNFMMLKTFMVLLVPVIRMLMLLTQQKETNGLTEKLVKVGSIRMDNGN